MARKEKLDELISNIEQIIYGKREIIELIITALLADGHVLLEDVPGVGKTKLIEALSRSLDAKYNRLQMTPDVMPSDIVGFSLIDSNTKELTFRKGAVFCNFLLADEINRSSPKSQSALLEVMEENQVSIDGSTFILEQPFMVLATQNPVETYGTYHLPEAQMDRFLMKLNIGYPSIEEENDIIRNSKNLNPKKLNKVLSSEQIVEMKNEVLDIHVSDAAVKYIVDIVNSTRNTEGIRLGVSPRGSICLYNSAKAYSYLKGENYVSPDTIKYLAPFVLSHRIILTPQGKAMWKTPNYAIEDIVSKVTVPIE